MDEATIIKQDKSEDLTVAIRTTQTDSGYITTISIQTEDSRVIEEIKTSSLEMAERVHENVVSRLIKKRPAKLFDRIDGENRPEVGAKNPYLNGAASFTPMLPGTVG